MYECIVKTAKNKLGNILWQSVYVDNKKEIENYEIDLQKILKYYAPNNSWREVVIIEDDVYECLDEYFPETEDFTYLMDCTELFEGKEIYLLDGKNIINKFWDDYRQAGFYYRWHWEEIDKQWYCAKYKEYFNGHKVIKFTVVGSDEEYIWEDWNYHQSFLYMKYEK